MDLKTALEIARDAVDKSSQTRIADKIGVGNSSLSRWLAGHAEPEGEKREKLFQWAEKQLKPATVREAAPASYQSDNPIQRIYATRSQEQGAWLWDYTVEIMEAMVEQLRMAKPPTFATRPDLLPQFLSDTAKEAESSGAVPQSRDRDDTRDRRTDRGVGHG